MSRFTSAHWQSGRLQLRNTVSAKAVFCDDLDILKLVQCFATPTTVDALAKDARVADLELDDAVCALLAAGILVREDAEPVPEGNAGPFDSTSYWHPSELALQVHSREQAGAGSDTFRFRGAEECEPAVKSKMSDERIQLYRDDQPTTDFWETLMQRRSIRAPTARMTLKDLGTFFHWTMRNWDKQRTKDGRTLVHRCYPSGGSMYALEVYPVVPEGSVDGLSAGIYHYCPEGHLLERVSNSVQSVSEITRIASTISANDPDNPPPLVTLLVTTRLARAAHKYDYIPYVTQLKDVGALYSYFYLVGTALGLATCAYGGGFPSKLLANATGIDPLVEPVIGEFGLGALMDGPGNNVWPARAEPKP